MKTLYRAVLFLVLSIAMASQAWAAGLGIADGIDEVFFEKETESRLARDIKAYLGHDRFIIGVDFKIGSNGAPGGDDPVIIREITTPLPGLPKATETFTRELTSEELANIEENLFIDNQIGTRSNLLDGQTSNGLTGSGTEVFLVLDTTVNSVQESFIRELVAKKLALDVVGGDSIAVVRSTFSEGLNQQQAAPQVQEELQQNPQQFPSQFPQQGGFSSPFFPSGAVPIQNSPAATSPSASAGETLSDETLLAPPTVDEIAAAVVAATSESLAANEGGFLEDNLLLVSLIGGLVFLLFVLFLFLMMRRPSYPPMPFYPSQPQPASANGFSESGAASGARSSSTDSVDSESRGVRNSIGEVRREIASIGLASPESSKTEMESLLAQGRVDVVAPVYKVLGEDVFESLFGDMSLGQKSEIGEYLAEREISDTQLEAQAKEFYSRLVRGASESASSNRSQAFKFLDKLHLSQVLFLIKGEKPRIQALIISQLPAKTASGVLQSLEAGQRSEIIHELAQFETFPVETFKDVASLLAKKARKLPSVENVHTDGIGILMGLLDSMNTAEEGRVLSDLAVKDPELHQKLRSQYFTFSDMAKAPQKIMGEAMLDIDKGTIAAALDGANDNIVRRVLGSMPKRLADSVKEEMNLLKGKIDDEQVQSGRKVMVGRMRELVREGKIEIDKL